MSTDPIKVFKLSLIVQEDADVRLMVISLSTVSNLLVVTVNTERESYKRFSVIALPSIIIRSNYPLKEDNILIHKSSNVFVVAGTGLEP